MVHVLEHVEDPYSSIISLANALEDNGCIYIEVPNLFGIPLMDDAHLSTFTLDSLRNYGIKPINKIKKNHYDVIILTVAHKKFKIFNKKKLASIGKKINVVYDVKNFLPREIVDGRL